MKNGKIVIGVIAPKLTDGPALYRSVGPFTALAGTGLVSDPRYKGIYAEFNDSTEIRFLQGTGWPALYDMDVLFMQRPTDQKAVEMAMQASRNGVLVWLDWDQFGPFTL